MGVVDAETAIKQQHEDSRYTQEAGLTTWHPENAFEKMLNAMSDGYSELPRSNDNEDGECGEDEEDDTAYGTLSDNDQPCWRMGDISKQ